MTSREFVENEGEDANVKGTRTQITNVRMPKEDSVDVEINVSPKVICGYPKFITIAELMACTKISRATICRHIKAGTIPATKIGKRVLIDAEFLNYLKNQTVTPNGEDKR